MHKGFFPQARTLLRGQIARLEQDQQDLVDKTTYLERLLHGHVQAPLVYQVRCVKGLLWH